MGRWSLLSICSPTDQLHLLLQFRPAMETSGELSPPVRLLIRVALSGWFRTARLLSNTHFIISSPLVSGGCIESHRGSWPFISPTIILLEVAGMCCGAKATLWVVFDGGVYTLVTSIHLARLSFTRMVEDSVPAVADFWPGSKLRLSLT